MLRHIEFWLTNIEDRAGFPQLTIQLRTLQRGDTYHLSYMLNIGNALREQLNKLAHHNIQPWNSLQSAKCSPIIGMLKYNRIQARKASARLRLSSRHARLPF